MLFTSAGVLLIGAVRWLTAMVIRPTATADADTAAGGAEPGGLVSRLAPIFGMLGGRKHEPVDDETADKAAKPGSRRTHAVGRSAKTARSARSADGRRTTKHPAASRSRHIRPPLDDAVDPTLDRARRRRPPRPREFDAPEPPRRGRVPRDPDLRERPSREIRRDPHARKGRPTRRTSRLDPYEPNEPYEPSAPPAPRRRPAPNGISGATATHHPISQVRYRGATGADEPRNEPTSRPRRLRESPADSWDYDV